VSDELSFEDRFLITLRDSLEADDEIDLYNMLSQAEIVIKEDWHFSRKRSNQRSAVVEIKVPPSVKKKVEEEKGKLYKYCEEIYPDDDAYGFTGVEIGRAMASAISKKNPLNNKETKYLVKNHNYQNLIDKVSSMDVDQDQKTYVYEACNCAMNNNRIAAVTMLGCAAELLLIQLSKAYHDYLQANGTQTEADTFKNKVINARNAYTRLDEFQKRVESNAQLFKDAGFENPKLQFTFLDVIREVRNASGHPTGKKISPEDLSTMAGNYQLLLEKSLDLIKKYRT
jgi:hypothetical protein